MAQVRSIDMATPEQLVLLRQYQAAHRAQCAAMDGMLRRALRHVADCALLDLVRACDGSTSEVAQLAQVVHQVMAQRETIRRAGTASLPGMEQMTTERLAVLQGREDQARGALFALA